jgi:hypothetical protein
MRLSELNPKWCALREGGDAIAISFECPHCRECKLVVFFADPVDTNGLPGIDLDVTHYIAEHPERPYWHRTGDTYDTLTLSPSVDVSKHGHWHGFVTNGDII